MNWKKDVFCAAAAALTPKCASLFTNAEKGVFLERKQKETKNEEILSLLRRRRRRLLLNVFRGVQQEQCNEENIEKVRLL